MRSTPGRPYPLIIPLSTGLGKHSFAKIVFSHRVLTTFTQKVVFYLLARGQVAVPPIQFSGTLGGSQNPLKNDMKKRRSERGLKRTLGGSMGRPREPRGAPICPKWEPKESKNESKNGVFSGSTGKMEYVTKPHYLLYIKHISHPRN